MSAHCYLVSSKEYTYVEPVLDFGQGPSYTVRDTIFVRARNRQRAKVLAVRFFRRQAARRGLRPGWDSFDENPYAGMLAEFIACEACLGFGAVCDPSGNNSPCPRGCRAPEDGAA